MPTPNKYFFEATEEFSAEELSEHINAMHRNGWEVHTIMRVAEGRHEILFHKPEPPIEIYGSEVMSTIEISELLGVKHD